MLITTIIEDVRSRQKLEVKLPTTFEVVKDLFLDNFGTFEAKTEGELLCHGLMSEAREEEEQYSFERANQIVRAMQDIIHDYGEQVLVGVLEEFSYEDLERYNNFIFYVSREIFLMKLYEDTGLSSQKIFGVTVDRLLNDNEIFELALTNGDVFESSNGTVIEYV